MDTQNIQEDSQKNAVEDTPIEDNSEVVCPESDTKSFLLPDIGMTPAQLTEAQGCNVSNIKYDLEQSVMLLIENEDSVSAYPPSKKLKTEQKVQDGGLVADRIEGCLIDTQLDRESESNINEKESQQSDTDCLLRNTNLLPEDQSKNDTIAGSKKTVTANDVYNNRIDCFSTAEKTKRNEVGETENNRVMNNKLFIANNQELEKLHDQEMQHSRQEILINITKRSSCNNLNVKCPEKEIIIFGRQNQRTHNQEITLNEMSYGKNNCFSLVKEKNNLVLESDSERNETASDEPSTGKYVENELNTKAEFISTDTTTDIQHNPKHEGNNETPSDVTVAPNDVGGEDNHCVLPAERGNGEEIMDTATETNLHTIIFEHKTSWTTILQNEVFKLVDLPCDSDKYTEIKTLFQSTTQKHFRLTKIVEVQNPFLYSCYLLKKAEMMSRYSHTDEKYLFHGTKIENISSICEKNLDWRKHGSVTGNIFGKGVSLTPISCYASHYSDKHLEEKIMFVFKVVIANETEGTPDMVLPPYKDTFNKLRYDTAVKPNRQVIVKFSDNEFYPEYLLYYTGSYIEKCTSSVIYWGDSDDSDDSDW